MKVIERIIRLHLRHSPKKELSIPKFLYAEELEELFEVSDTETPLGQRNQALLELMYATGIRVSECVNLQLTDIDFAVGTILVMGKGKKQRYIPFGSYAQDSLITYIENGRKQLVNKTDEDSHMVFLNAKGTPLTSRGVRYVLNELIKKGFADNADKSPYVKAYICYTYAR